MSDRYGVMGHPLTHTLSPRVHNMFAALTGEDVNYQALPISVMEPTHDHLLMVFVERLRSFFAEGGKGLNITLPFKEKAAQIATTLSTRAQKAGAVNTLKIMPDGLLGDNTDGVGLLADFMRLGIFLRGHRVLILGAGGAVRGIVPGLLEQQPAKLVIANRTRARAESLCAEFKNEALYAASFDALSRDHDHNWHLIIHATSAALHHEALALPEEIFTATPHAYDLSYTLTGVTPFVRLAQQHKVASCHDGLGMLIEQAAESFLLWRGIRPPTLPVLAELRTPPSD